MHALYGPLWWDFSYGERGEEEEEGIHGMGWGWDIHMYSTTKQEQ